MCPGWACLGFLTVEGWEAGSGASAGSKTKKHYRRNSNYQVIHIIKSTSFQIHHNPPKGVDDHCPGWFAGASRNWWIMSVKLQNAVQKNHPFAVAVLLHPVELLHDQLPPGAGDRPILGGRQLPGGRRGARLHPEVLQYVDGEWVSILYNRSVDTMQHSQFLRCFLVSI